MANKFRDINQGFLKQHLYEENILLNILESGDKEIFKNLDIKFLPQHIHQSMSVREQVLLYLLTTRRFFESGNENLRYYINYFNQCIRSKKYTYYDIDILEYTANMGDFPFSLDIDSFYNFDDFLKFINIYGQNMIPEIFHGATNFDEYGEDDEDTDGEYGSGFTDISYVEIDKSISELKRLYTTTSYYYYFENNKIYSQEIDMFINKYKNDDDMLNLLLEKVSSMLGLLSPRFFLISKPYIRNNPFSSVSGSFSNYIEFGVTVSTNIDSVHLNIQNYNLLRRNLYGFYDFICEHISTTEAI